MAHINCNASNLNEQGINDNVPIGGQRNGHVNGGVGPYTLLENAETIDSNVPWLERFYKWTQRVNADPHFVQDQSPDGWTVTLTLNTHPVPNHVGHGATLKLACADLARNLEVANFFTKPLRPDFSR